MSLARVRDRFRWRLLAALIVGVLPWSVVISGQLSLVFSFGLVNVQPLHLTTVWDYVFVYTRGLPRFLLAWPISTLLYVGGLVSILSGRLGIEDERVTAGLFAFAGCSQLWVAWGFTRRLSSGAIPLGAGLLFVLAWLSISWSAGAES